MQETFTTQITVGPSTADSTGRLGFADTFGVFQDAAALHAEKIGVGFKDMMQKGMFWLTVKTQVHFIDRPRIMTEAELTTWPDAPGRMRGCRSYLLTQNGATCAIGKTEWAVINTETKALVPLSAVYPEELNFTEPTVTEEPFIRVAADFEGVEPYARYTVSSTDIDVGGHMNNTAYVRAVMGSLSNKEIEELNIKRMDVIFRAQCFEGDELTLQKVQSENGLSVRVSKDDETVLLVEISSR